MRHLWVLKVAAPGGDNRVWGDVYYGAALAKELTKLGIEVITQYADRWNEEYEEAEVVLSFRGLQTYIPDRERCPHTVFIMWNISQPSMVCHSEYNLFDLVCVASNEYTQQLRRYLTVPCIPLLQCTDTDTFHPMPEITRNKRYLFVGNSRQVHRSSVIYAEKNGLPLDLYGLGWDILPEDFSIPVISEFVENDRLPELYAGSRICLNDHWDDMRRYGFINNRTFDILACGTPVLSDYLEELEKIFPKEVIMYQNEDQFRAGIEFMEEHYDTISERIQNAFDRIQKEYSFRSRAYSLVALCNALRK